MNIGFLITFVFFFVFLLSFVGFSDYCLIKFLFNVIHNLLEFLLSLFIMLIDKYHTPLKTQNSFIFTIYL